MRKLFLFTCILLVCVAPSYAQFTFTTIDYAGGVGTRVRGINNHGDMVGSYVSAVDGNSHALLIKHGQFIPLAPNTVLGTDFSDAFKINDRGDIVGYYCDDTACHGFLFSKGVLTTLDFPGASDTGAWGINDSGVIVGFWDSYDSDGNFLFEHGFAWNKGTFTDVVYPGGVDTSIGGNNALGAFVGIWDTGPTATVAHGFVAWKNNFLSFDAPFPDVFDTQANDINACGLIVGMEFTPAQYDSGLPDGFLAIGPYFFNIDYPGALGTSAWGINSAGVMVGNWYDSNFNAHGWIAQVGGKGKLTAITTEELTEKSGVPLVTKSQPGRLANSRIKTD